MLCTLNFEISCVLIMMWVTSYSAYDKNLLSNIMIKKYDINAYFEFWNELCADYDVGHFWFVDTMYNRFFTQSGIQSHNCKRSICYIMRLNINSMYCNTECNDCTQLLTVKPPSSNPIKNFDYSNPT